MTDLEREALVATIKSTLVQSGKLKEIQARLRSQIYLALSQEATSLTRAPAESSGELRALNWLVCQHLVQNAYWMANSVFSRDGFWTNKNLRVFLFSFMVYFLQFPNTGTVVPMLFKIRT